MPPQFHATAVALVVHSAASACFWKPNLATSVSSCANFSVCWTPSGGTSHSWHFAPPPTRSVSEAAAAEGVPARDARTRVLEQLHARHAREAGLHGLLRVHHLGDGRAELHLSRARARQTRQVSAVHAPGEVGLHLDSPAPVAISFCKPLSSKGVPGRDGSRLVL